MATLISSRYGDRYIAELNQSSTTMHLNDDLPEVFLSGIVFGSPTSEVRIMNGVTGAPEGVMASYSEGPNQIAAVLKQDANGFYPYIEAVFPAAEADGATVWIYYQTVKPAPEEPSP